MGPPFRRIVPLPERVHDEPPSTGQPAPGEQISAALLISTM
ncbi:hypothetical protein [Streptosporangium roseum]|nr:hypothetical protein [Streptosporangium roseum]